jgi:two-component system, sensor histidine kinase and response regulator
MRMVERGALLPPEMVAAVSGPRILVADDSDLIRLLIKRQLAMLGWACDGARHGEDALQLWRRQPSRYWLLLTDLDMPQMDGFALARSVRGENSAGARLPIVAYSGNASPDVAQHGRRAGIDEILAKPAELQELNSLLQRWRPRPTLVR